MNPTPHSKKCDRDIPGSSESFSRKPDVQQKGWQRPECGMRMVYESELRKACGQRKLDDEQLRRWIEIRRKLPINRWIDRNSVMLAGHAETVALKQEIEQFLKLFDKEAEEYRFRMNMERNYYRAAVNLMSGYAQGATLSEKDSRLLSGLMVMVDLKDARLAMQILASIV